MRRAHSSSLDAKHTSYRRGHNASVSVARGRTAPYAWAVTSMADQPTSNWPLRERPGFLIRRLHQIHVALFNEACAQFDITTVQFSLLSALSVRGTTDQTTLAAQVALDRTTTTGALKRLQARGLVERTTSLDDRRAQECRVTGAGLEILGAMEAAARRAHLDTMSALDRSEQKTLLRLIRKIVDANERADAG